MKRKNFWMHTGQLKQLAVLGKGRGLKVSALIRIAIGEFLVREARKDRAAKRAAAE